MTGAGRGIGRAYAHALGEAGAAVALLDINYDSACTVADELARKGIEALPVYADVREEAEVRAAVKSVVDRWDRLTIGVNNAGIAMWQPAETVTREQWDTCWRST